MFLFLLRKRTGYEIPGTWKMLVGGKVLKAREEAVKYRNTINSIAQSMSRNNRAMSKTYCCKKWYESFNKYHISIGKRL